MSKEKVEWIYKGISGLVDREEYLTGRKIDKTFELLEQEENGKYKGDLEAETLLPPSLFTDRLSEQSIIIDLENKMREDPLVEMRKKQMEERKKLLTNPVKMKRLKELIQSSLVDDHKKRRKKSRRDSSTSSSSTTSSSSSNSSSSSSSSVMSSKDSHDKNNVNKRSPNYKQISRSKSRRLKIYSHSPDRISSTNLKSKNSNSTYNDAGSSKSIVQNYNSSSRQRKEKVKSHLSKSSHVSIKGSKEHHTRNSSSYYKKPERKERGEKHGYKDRLSAEELEKRRLEMLQDGKCREQQRKATVEFLKNKEETENDSYLYSKILKN